MIGKGKGIKSRRRIRRAEQPGENNLPLFMERFIDNFAEAGPLTCDLCGGSGIIPGQEFVHARNQAGEPVAWSKNPDRVCPCSTTRR